MTHSRAINNLKPLGHENADNEKLLYSNVLQMTTK